MALIKCPECESEISDKAEACPKCGCPIQKIQSETETDTVSFSEVAQAPARKSRFLIILIISIILIILLFIIFGLFHLSGKNHQKTHIETTDETYNLDKDYNFKGIRLCISDEWECKETYDTCTITCLEDYSFLVVNLFDTSLTPDVDSVYNSCLLNDEYENVSELKKFKDIPLYTFEYTNRSLNAPIQCLYYIKDDIIYVISVPKLIDEKESIIYSNLDTIIRPLATTLFLEEQINEAE